MTTQAAALTRRRSPVWVAFAALSVGAPRLLPAQTLTLADALGRAQRAAYPNRIAEAVTAGQAGQALLPLQGVLPTLRFEGGYQRTTDPLNAFGFTLRQRAVTPASFAPNALNYPTATGNLATGIVLELPLFNADAWLGRKAAARATDAARASEGWTRGGTAVGVVQAYFGAVLATERVATLDSAVQAARAHVRQAESLEAHGLVTRSDALLASVKAGDLELQLIEARGEAGLARQGLAVVMGDPADTSFSLPLALPTPEQVEVLAVPSDADTGTVATRSDIQAARFALAAADADVQRATSLYLPRLNSFGRLDWNHPDTPFGGQESWTVGIMLSWSPFAGSAQMGERRMANGRRAEARAQADAAMAQAELDLARAQTALSVALARIEIAARAVTQSIEAHRIVGRKYESGLSSVMELLDAAAVETQSRLEFAQARYEALVAAVQWRRAHGLDLGALTELDVSSPDARNHGAGL